MVSARTDRNLGLLPDDQPYPSHPQTKQTIEPWQSHRRYTRMINFREHWKGYLWQGRFASYPMEKRWLLKTAAYVKLSPVKAGLVKKAWDYRWSSVHAHLSGKDKQGIIQAEEIEQHARTGRPLVANNLQKIEKEEAWGLK